MSGLLVLAYPLAFASGAGLVYTAARHFAPQIRARLASEEAAFAEALRDIFAEGISPRHLVALRWAVAPGMGLLVWVGTGSLVFAVVIGGVLAVTPRTILDYARKRRRDRLEAQVIDLISSMSATTKAGMNLLQSLEEVATRMPPPMSQEFAMVLQRVRAGQTVEAALRACDARLDLPNLSLVLQSIIVNEERGGKLPALLEKLSDSLREIHRVEERVKTETSGIKLSSRIMAGMPLVVGFLLYLVAPDHVTMLFNTLVGNVILLVAGILDYVGFTMIKKLSNLEI